MFCTYDPITRAQLASYLARALDLPASDTDFFTDDNGHAREADINRAAAAGLFAGCAATKFCPSGTVTRGSMATVLVRARPRLRPRRTTSPMTRATATRRDINAVAEAGLMAGCTATTFCPARKVTRGATMQLLHAIFGAEPPPDDPPPPADEASIDGAFTDADPGGGGDHWPWRGLPGTGAASDGALASWVAPTVADRVAPVASMECPIVRYGRG